MEKNKVLNIFSNIRHRLRATARNIAGEDNADDILQDAFCKLWTMHNIPSDIEQTEKITATIVRNISIDYWREKNGSTRFCVGINPRRGFTLVTAGPPTYGSEDRIIQRPRRGRTSTQEVL